MRLPAEPHQLTCQASSSWLFDTISSPGRAAILRTMTCRHECAEMKCIMWLPLGACSSYMARPGHVSAFGQGQGLAGYLLAHTVR